MSRITHLNNGAMIKADVIESFDNAFTATRVLDISLRSDDFWKFVECDMYFDLIGIYKPDYIKECFNALATLEKELA